MAPLLEDMLHCPSSHHVLKTVLAWARRVSAHGAGFPYRLFMPGPAWNF